MRILSLEQSKNKFHIICDVHVCITDSVEIFILVAYRLLTDRYVNYYDCFAVIFLNLRLYSEFREEYLFVA